MVFFTCNACGSSLKKNQVEKHYQNECRNCEVLSCIDCGKDFYGDEYMSHTKCISEAEKYQGSLYKKEESTGKGEKKQQEWLEKVKQSVSGAKAANPRIGRLLERVLQYPNIPRKKTKFENFVRNSCNVYDERTLTELWEAFGGATKQQSPAVPNGPAAAKVSNSDAGSNLTVDKTNAVDQDMDTDEKSRRKKKKANDEEPSQCNGEMLEPETQNLDVPKSKKKKKKQKEDESDTAVQPEEPCVKAPKKKKKKRSPEKMLSEESGQPTVDSCSDRELSSTHHRKHHLDCESEEHEPVKKAKICDEELPCSKKHKKKHKHKQI